MLARKRALSSSMHTQAAQIGRPTPPRTSSAASAAEDLSASAQVALRALSEQVAMPLDQLARFCELSFEAAIRALQELGEAGCIEHRRFLVRDFPWYWPSRRGARLAGTRFPYRCPDVSSLAHRRAISEIRIFLARRAPHGRWLCERCVYRRRDPDDHLPDALFEVDGERHAIEAELSRKGNAEIRQIVAQHSDRYDAVLYFCGKRTYRMMKRLEAEGRWPKLVVRPLPEAG
jgi:hypothetical protein